MGKKLEHNAIKTVQYETLYTYFLVMIIFFLSVFYKSYTESKKK